MELATFQRLLSPEGQRAIADALAQIPTEARFLAHSAALGKTYPAELARAALETALLRAKGLDKFPAAGRMYFTRQGLEQSSSDAVARHRAQRFARFGRVADLCCGIGADAVVLASVCANVVAVDSDPLKVAMCEANAVALGVGDRVRAAIGDALAVPLEVEAAFADPDRRSDGRRFLDPEEYAPPLRALRARFPADFALAVKVAPGIAKSDLPPEAEVEFVSVRGELKECVLWFGAFREVTRRATSLYGGAVVGTGDEQASVAEGVKGFVYDPDPAVTRAGLVPVLAEQLGAELTDHEVQLLTNNELTTTGLATAFRVEHADRFHPGKLREFLRARNVGRVTVIKRGSPADADVVIKQLKLAGSEHRTLLLTRVGGAHTAIVCERLG